MCVSVGEQEGLQAADRSSEELKEEGEGKEVVQIEERCVCVSRGSTAGGASQTSWEQEVGF